MYKFEIVLPFLALLAVGSATLVNQGKPIFCSRATISQVRIQGCDKEPCTLKKGTRLPFEIDFSFAEPQSATEVSLSAIAPYWGVPPAFYGTELASRRSGTRCQDFAGKCPAQVGKGYTIKSTLYADPKLQKTVGDKEKTGKVTTGWLLTPRNNDGSNKQGSQCSFNVDINLVN